MFKKEKTNSNIRSSKKTICLQSFGFLRIMFEDNFLEKFNNQDSFDSTLLPNNEKRELIKKSLPCLITKVITEDDIYDFVFNANESDSLVNITNKALHLSTTSVMTTII